LQLWADKVVNRMGETTNLWEYDHSTE